MAKISPVSSKYIVHTQITIEGVVEKPDVIGAIFGQTEGLLGNELELRELQRNGRIGRIEVKLDIRGGKASGTIIIPSSLDKAETVIIAAALETIQRIGPCNAKVEVKNIEDVRISKRLYVIERAKELLRELTERVLPDSQEITDEVAYSVRMMEIVEYGKDRLPAGPSIEESDEVIVVEGRADVLNLLKHGMKNVIALNGTSVPETVKELSRRKVITAFVDGDRGGDLIIRELISTCEIDYVIKAPDGKEVEEITKKEIHKALRSKIAVEQIKLEVNGTNGRDSIKSHDTKDALGRIEQGSPAPVRRPAAVAVAAPKKDLSVFKEMLDDLVGTRGAYILDSSAKILGKVPTSELTATIKNLNPIHAIVFDGMISYDIVKAAEKSNTHYLVAMDSKVRQAETKIELVTKKDL